MNLSACIDGDLVAGPDGEAWVVVRPVVPETLACSRVCLLVQRAGDRQLP